MTDQATRRNAPQRDPNIGLTDVWYDPEARIPWPAEHGPHRLTMSTATLDLLRGHGNLAHYLAAVPAFERVLLDMPGVPVHTDDDMWLGAVQVEYTDGSVQALELQPTAPQLVRPHFLAECPYERDTLAAAAWELRRCCRDLLDELTLPAVHALTLLCSLFRRRAKPRQDTTA